MHRPVDWPPGSPLWDSKSGSRWGHCHRDPHNGRGRPATPPAPGAALHSAAPARSDGPVTRAPSVLHPGGAWHQCRAWSSEAVSPPPGEVLWLFPYEVLVPWPQRVSPRHEGERGIEIDAPTGGLISSQSLGHFYKPGKGVISG